MRNFARYALIVCAAAASLAGCGASSQSSFELPRTTQGSSAIGAYARSLLYVVGSASAEVFTYPHGKPVGFLGLFDNYICSDKFGNVFITGAEGISNVWVFPHGSGQPLATLYNPQSPGGCSVDKNTEDLAVANPDLGPSIVIFPYNKRKHSWRLARQYNDSNMRASLYCSYDFKGNLFIGWL